MPVLILGTRGSALARWQAELVTRLLLERRGELEDLELRTEIIRTRAEKFPERAIESIGVGVFTKELDDALRRREIDFAVHSLKDLPSRIDADLAIAAVLPRESPFDAFVSREGVALRDLPPGSRIGTGSPRRRAQLLALRSDLEVVPLRGNVDTRLAKLETEGLAGTILAHAGLRRLGREEVVTEVLTIDAFVPAVGQGAIAIVARADDAETRSVLEAIEDEGTRAEIEAERAYLAELRGGCQVPAGALARRREESLEIVAVIASPDGRELVRGSLSGATTDARSLGEELARRLLREGGARLLEGMRE